MMTAQELARTLAAASKIKGLVVLYEISRNRAAAAAVTARQGKELRAATQAMLDGTETIEYISKMAVRRLNADKSLTFSETAIDARGQHVPEADVTKATRALGMPAEGIQLQVIQVGSAADMEPRRGQGAVVVEGGARKRIRQQNDDEKQQRKEDEEKRIADKKANLEREIRKIVEGFRCPKCEDVYAFQKSFAKHVVTCMGGDDDDAGGAAQPRGGGECLRDVAAAAHTAASDQQQQVEDQRRNELGRIAVAAPTADELEILIGQTYPLVPVTAKLIRRGSSNGKFWATFQRAPPAYWRGQARHPGDRDGFTPVVDMLVLLLPKYQEYKANSGISMYRLWEILEEMPEFKGKEYLMPTLEQLDQWWKAENDRDYKPLIAIDSRVVIIDDTMKDQLQALFKAAAKSKNGKKKDVNASSSSSSSAAAAAAASSSSASSSSSSSPSAAAAVLSSVESKMQLQVVQDLATARSASHPELRGTIVSRKKGRWFVRMDASGSEVSWFAKDMLLLPGDPLFETLTHGGRKHATVDT